jgi:hypothetical protein
MIDNRFIATERVYFMSSIVLDVISLTLAFVFMVMWIRARRAAVQAEIVAYGLRSQDGGDEVTRTNLINMDKEYHDAISKLSQLGQIERDNWGRWVWIESGQQLAQN